MFFDGTNFDDGEWGGWENTSKNLVLSDGAVRYLKPASPPESFTLLKKTFSHLVKGTRYEFRVSLAAGNETGTEGQSVAISTLGAHALLCKVGEGGQTVFTYGFRAQAEEHEITLSYNYQTVPGNGNFALSELIVSRSGHAVDYTDFKSGMNGWQIEPNGFGLEILSEHGGKHYVGFSKPSDHTVLGVVLIKQIEGLADGEEYEFGVSTRQAGFDINKTVQIGLKIETGESSGLPLTSRDWSTHKLAFTPRARKPLKLSVSVSENFDTRPRGIVIDNCAFAEVDFTDFSGEGDARYNDWVVTKATSSGVKFEEHGSEGTVLAFRTTSDRPNAGSVLSKACKNLQTGSEYEFMMRVKALTGVSPARLSVAFDGQEVRSEFPISNVDDWEELRGTFTAVGGDNMLSITNHNDTGNGNNYAFSVLQYRQIG